MRIGFIFIVVLCFISCSTIVSKKESTMKNLNDVLIEKEHNRYSAWINGNSKEELMYYSDINNYHELINNRNGLSSGWDLLIYYNNKTKFDDLKAINIIGFYNGDSEKTFKIIVEDIQGRVLYESEDHKYIEFPNEKDKLRVVSFEIPIKNVPKGF
jgi:hypothetical protein